MHVRALVVLVGCKQNGSCYHVIHRCCWYLKLLVSACLASVRRRPSILRATVRTPSFSLWRRFPCCLFKKCFIHSSCFKRTRSSCGALKNTTSLRVRYDDCHDCGIVLLARVCVRFVRCVHTCGYVHVSILNDVLPQVPSHSSLSPVSHSRCRRRAPASWPLPNWPSTRATSMCSEMDSSRCVEMCVYIYILYI